MLSSFIKGDLVKLFARSSVFRGGRANEKRGYYLVVEFGCEAADVYDYLHGFLHHLNRNEFVWTVEIYSSGEDVRAW